MQIRNIYATEIHILIAAAGDADVVLALLVQVSLEKKTFLLSLRTVLKFFFSLN